MGLFDKNNKNKFCKEIDKWFGSLSNVTDAEGFAKAVERIDFGRLWKEGAFDYTIEKCKTLDPQKLPFLIDALYRSDDSSKFLLGCAVLDTTCESLPFVPPLEDVEISDEKFKTFWEALISVWARCFNGIGDCMMLILLNFAGRKDMFTAEQVSKIIEITTEETTAILDWIEESNPAPDQIPHSLELLMDVAGYFGSNELLDLAERALSVNNKTAQLFAAIALLKNDRKVSPRILETLAEDMETAYKLLMLLERVDRVDLYPEKYAMQSHIAKAHLCDWLIYPTELGALPDEIEQIQTMEYDFGDDEAPDIQVFYVFKFRSEKEAFRDKGWMVGLCGGYEKGVPLTTSSTGHTFSMFETLEGDGLQQGEKIFNLISDHWKQRAAEVLGEN
jgi:hypothetical protein